jgi:peptide/nickel transport system permease protein
MSTDTMTDGSGTGSVGDRAVARSRRYSATAVATWLFVGLLVALMLTAPLLAPYDPATQDLGARLRPPVFLSGGDWSHPLGTDQLGRDLLSRLLWGARSSLAVAMGATFVATAIGVVLGMTAGYFGGLYDLIVMRVADIQMSFPGLMLSIAVVAVVGAGPWVLIAVLGVQGWMLPGRLTRGLVLSLRESEFVLSARAIGTSKGRIMRVHLLRNIQNTILTLIVIEMALLLLAEATLSFLGLGIQPPATSWGLIIGEGRAYLTPSWWVVTFPGAAICLTVSTLNVMANRLQKQSTFANRV